MFYTKRTDQNFQISERIISGGTICDSGSYFEKPKALLYIFKSFCLFLLLLIVIGLGFVTIGWLLMLPIWVKL